MKKGFTLIELLVVITILAVLAGAALPYVQNYVEESRNAKTKADLEEIARALVIYETREGEYTKKDVSDLTGRYLNKAPVDPWGSSYIVAPEGGIVYSSGPDRNDEIDGKSDNIYANYQSPLALVSVKWDDRNRSGNVDTQNVPDTLQLTFSRIMSATDTLAASEIIKIGNKIFLSTDTSSIGFALGDLNASGGIIAIASPPRVIASRTLVYELNPRFAGSGPSPKIGAGHFIAGRDALTIEAGHDIIKDMAENDCISDQRVKILAK